MFKSHIILVHSGVAGTRILTYGNAMEEGSQLLPAYLEDLEQQHQKGKWRWYCHCTVSFSFEGDMKPIFEVVSFKGTHPVQVTELNIAGKKTAKAKTQWGKPPKIFIDDLQPAAVPHYQDPQQDAYANIVGDAHDDWMAKHYANLKMQVLNGELAQKLANVNIVQGQLGAAAQMAVNLNLEDNND